MPRITIDDMEYNSEDLSEAGQAQLASLQFVEKELTRLDEELSALEAARTSAIRYLKSTLTNIDDADGN